MGRRAIIDEFTHLPLTAMAKRRLRCYVQRRCRNCGKPKPSNWDHTRCPECRTLHLEKTNAARQRRRQRLRTYLRNRFKPKDVI